MRTPDLDEPRRRSRLGPRLIPLFCLLLLTTSARAGDVCVCGEDDVFTWSAVGQTAGSGGWSCSGGDGVPGADDDFRIGAGCAVQATGDIVQDGASSTAGLTVLPGGLFVAEVGSGDRLRLSLNGGGLFCRGECRLAGAFRELDASPANHADPSAWSAGLLEPCDGDCAATPERYCLGYPTAAPTGLGEALDRVVPASDLGKGTQDWLCFWDFDKSDALAAFDDNACYPISSVRGAAEGLPYQLCVDVRQGRDNNYPHRLRVVDEGLLAAPLAASEGCSYVLHPPSGRRTASCGGAFVRVQAGSSGIQADEEYVGRFLRFPDAEGQPRTDSYKILQTLDCAAAPAAPHPCAGSSDDIIVLGSLAGVAAAQAAGDVYWIDYGWKPGESFFVMAPVQLDNATPVNDDGNVDLTGEIDFYGVHVTDLGGGRSDANGRDNTVVVVGGSDDDANHVARWRHVILRNDTGAFVPNTGQDLMPDGLQDAVFGHTNIIANTGHAVLLEATHDANEGLVFEDTSIRHHHDGCFNHSSEAVEPGVTVRRAWCAFIQKDALSAQFFAWQEAIPSETLIEDSGCDACDEGHSGNTLRSNNDDASGGWVVRRTLFWAPRGSIANAARMEDSLLVGLRGSATLASTLLPYEVERVVVRDIGIHTTKAFAAPLDFRDSVFRDVLLARATEVAVAQSDARVENVAWLNFDNMHPTCLAGSKNCAIATQYPLGDDEVEWKDQLFAWTPGRETGFVSALRHLATAADPPRYDGVAIAHHRFVNGVGEAFGGLTAGNVGVPDWDHGPCFFDAERDVNPAAAAGMPPTTSTGIPLGFVDPASSRFDTPPGSHADDVGCGLDPAEPVGNRVYSYFHARTGLAPEIMADDLDRDGVPENIPAATCTGPIGSSACVDNCAGLFNPDQADADADAVGDACDAPCANGLDDDGDGRTDWPADPGCQSASSASESPRCQNGIDDEGDGRIDFDGAASWNGGVPLTLPDPDCRGLAHRDRERPKACGLGFELAPVLLGLAALRRRRAQPSGA